MIRKNKYMNVRLKTNTKKGRRMKEKTEDSKKQYINIYESELRIMAGNALAWGNTESGGTLFGLQTHGGRPVVMLATPPGRNAQHSFAHFAQDAEYVMEIAGELKRMHGIQILGDFHSHHDIPLDRPSGDDRTHIRRIAARNGIPCMVQLILTFEKEEF